MSFTIHEDIIIYLENLVSEHHELYVEIFNDNLKPKHHFMVHYGTIIRHIGPIRQIWCMRFESKHTFFKSVSKITKNRINLLETFALKTQLSLANLLLNDNESYMTNVTSHTKQLSSMKYSFALVMKDIESIEEVEVLSQIVVNKSSQIKEGSCICIENVAPFNENEFPTFLKSEMFFRIGNKYFVGGEVLHNNGFNRLYYGYSIDYTNHFVVIPIELKFRKLYHVITAIEHNILTIVE